MRSPCLGNAAMAYNFMVLLLAQHYSFLFVCLLFPIPYLLVCVLLRLHSSSSRIESAILVYGSFLEVDSGLSTPRNFAETAKKDGIYDNLGLAS